MNRPLERTSGGGRGIALLALTAALQMHAIPDLASAEEVRTAAGSGTWHGPVGSGLQLAQAAPSAETGGVELSRGRAVFLSQGCGACHTVRGTPAQGTTGPDLTHVGSRTTIGAGMLPTSVEAFENWVGHTQEVKPGARMPSYDDLDPKALSDLAHYLDGLK